MNRGNWQPVLRLQRAVVIALSERPVVQQVR
jgi:hypothetical protein